MDDRWKNLRNVLIIFILAAIVWGIPGGATAGTTIGNIVTILFAAAMAFFAYRMYMEHRDTLFDLPDNHRLLLYASVAVATITLIATSRMWDAGGPWILIWFALILSAIYGVYVVIRAYRTY